MMEVTVEETSALPNSPVGEALKISLPIMVYQFVVMTGGFISNLMLSRVDTTAFAAGLLSNSIQMLLLTVVFGVLHALSPLVSQVRGENIQPQRVGHLFSAALCVAFLLCVPTMVTLTFIGPILPALAQPPQLVRACEGFFSGSSQETVEGLRAIA